MRNLTEVTPSRIVNGLAGYGENLALAHSSGTLSYAELAAAVVQEAARFADGRRLVVVSITNEPGSIIAYLAALWAAQPVILISPDSPDSLERILRTYDPDSVYTAQSGWVDRRAASIHELHPDLALLLSTSGSTGSPKLVRLTYDNLDANADSIAEYLAIRSSDRAVTTLPLNYCYGLSVLHSYLLRGAGLLLTDDSVAEPRFWETFRRHGGTSLAGVPYTFELLERAGFTEMELPTLRYITQAGGRMDPGLVRKYSQLGRQRGWELVVMYGQTEATARMAYLPPSCAAEHPQAIGVPIPGGAFTLAACEGFDGHETGELVYTGPNVMLGYAQHPSDLSRGRDLEELRTGDIATRTMEGLYEIVGRRSRFAKIFGLRIDLHHIEATLREEGVAALAAATDEHLVVAVTNGAAERVRQRVASFTKLPGWTITVADVTELPRLENGKPNYPAVLALRSDSPQASNVADLLSNVLNVPLSTITPNDSFTTLGGNSLSYVTMSVRLEKLLGNLPRNWHALSIAQLETAMRPRSSWLRTVETPILLRAVAIIAIVGVHVPLWKFLGGAHILLAVAGYMFARFTLSGSSIQSRRGAILKALGGVAIPSVAWIAAVYVATDWYEVSNLFLVNKLVGPHTRTSGVLWFIEILALILVSAAVLFSFPAVARLQRCYPFGFPVALTGVGIAFRYGLPWDPIAPKDAVYLPLTFWVFTLGWAAWAARTWQERAFVTTLAAVFLPTYFDGTRRGILVLAGVLLLLWVRSVRLPAPVVWGAALVAHSSLYIYLTHWQVFPFVRDEFGKWTALVASIVIGIAYHRAGSWALRQALRQFRTVVKTTPRATLLTWSHRITKSAYGGAKVTAPETEDTVDREVPDDRDEQQKIFDAAKGSTDPEQPKEHVSEEGAVGGTPGTTDGQ
ncbi:AMP-binding protein [Hoyosella altamirensis]|uniref:Acyl-CoA synthetase (AMP-forming)/AMP-acid ligase II n=1 Tax=Hoyosella altamirensis TaxID=616997 RepID=A0A839RFU3_9ACTN|nr:AMP-binding protein [Hoyosella altamirensis]MBB3035582.1 acyl-CoA synthetase (AMP-forming)/AMP-acid ligase II [Hoyosella altamirensis]